MAFCEPFRIEGLKKNTKIRNQEILSPPDTNGRPSRIEVMLHRFGQLDQFKSVIYISIRHEFEACS